MNRLLRFFLVMLFIAVSATPGSGCGPDFPQAIYTGRTVPDAPLEAYVTGRLGIVQPTYAQRYLVVAYDFLSGRPLSPIEQGSFGDFNKAPADQDLIVAFAHWQEARKQIIKDMVISETPDAMRRIPGQQYQYYENCLPDTYESAARTLRARIAAHAADAFNLQHWVGGQDVVFANCKGGTAIPAWLPNAPKWLQHDRSYQIASAHFYSGDFDSARLEYNAIAADVSSPWSTVANYLVARTDIRQAMLSGQSPDMAMLKQAEQHLEKLLQTKKAGVYAGSTRALLNYIRFRTDPAAQIVALAKEVSGRGEDSRFGQDVRDLTLLFDRGQGPAARAQSELIDWIMTMQSTSREDAAHALERWHATKKEVWLVAALTTAIPGSADVGELIDAAKSIPASSPAFASAIYHRAVLLNAVHRGEEVRGQLDAVLPGAARSQPLSTVNALMHERMLAADSLADFFAHLVRRPAKYGFSSGEAFAEDVNAQFDQYTLTNTLCAADQKESNEERALRFDEGGAAILNERFPIAQIIAGIDNEPMPSHLRLELELAAWTRAVLLGDAGTADHLVGKLSGCEPRLRPFLAVYRQAKSPEAKRFAAVYTILQFPGLQPYISTNLARTTDLEKIDEYRRNWWCGAAPSKDEAKQPLFLTEAEVVEDRKQQTALREIGSAPKYLSFQSVEWAKANPTDPRSPEALALSIRATRFGCTTNGDAGAASKAAFDLLHSQYPNSKWAKEYPYWFKD
jgi:hypothetical protein